MQKLASAQVKRRLKAVFAGFHRIGLKNQSFSILSNNCWGGAIYDLFGLMYRTPTIGLWIPAHDYIRFLANLDFYLKQEMKQISYLECHAADLLIARKNSGKYKHRLEDMVIGRLYDVDIIFLHYHSFSDAIDKWNRRKERINYDNLIVKYNDQNGFILPFYEEFIRLPYANKLFITSEPSLASREDVIYKEINSVSGEETMDDTKLSELPLDIKKYLNSII